MSHSAEENPWNTVSRKEVYDSPWIRVWHDEVVNPSGNPGIYGWVHFKHLAVGVIPLDDENNTWLVGQYRYPVGTYSWEIPEGGGHPDTAPLESAQRELLEETGIVAHDWQPLLEMRLSNAASDEIAFIYIARDLEFHQAQPDDNEALVVRKVPFQEAFEMTMRGEITDSMSVAAILKAQHILQRGSGG